jgi:hypothetical protein
MALISKKQTAAVGDSISITPKIYVVGVLGTTLMFGFGMLFNKRKRWLIRF